MFRALVERGGVLARVSHNAIKNGAVRELGTVVAAADLPYNQKSKVFPWNSHLRFENTSTQDEAKDGSAK